MENNPDPLMTYAAGAAATRPYKKRCEKQRQLLSIKWYQKPASRAAAAAVSQRFKNNNNNNIIKKRVRGCDLDTLHFHSHTSHMKKRQWCCCCCTGTHTWWADGYMRVVATPLDVSLFPFQPTQYDLTLLFSYSSSVSPLPPWTKKTPYENYLVIISVYI